MDKNEEKVLLICPLFADVGSEDLSAVSARQGARRMDMEKGQAVLREGEPVLLWALFCPERWSWSARTLSEN